jgi:hypothetical protein
VLRLKGDVDAELTKEVESNLPVMEALDLSKPGNFPVFISLTQLYSFHLFFLSFPLSLSSLLLTVDSLIWKH